MTRKIKDIMDKYGANFCLLAGTTILVFIFAILAITCSLFIFNIRQTALSFLGAVFIGVYFGWRGANIYFKDKPVKFYWLLMVLLILLALTSIGICGRFYDFWADGQAYHQEAIIQLTGGWNSFYEDLPPNIDVTKEINFFTKGPWVTAASLYLLTGRIEQSKAFNFLLIFAAFFLSFAALSSFSKIRPATAALISFLLAANPVSICQSLNFYVDGQLSSLLVCVAALACLFLLRPDRIITLVLTITIAMAMNAKMSATVYMAAFCSCSIGFLLLQKQNRSALVILKVSLVAFFIGILFIGFNPYMTNTIKYKDPFYPVRRIKNFSGMIHQMPKNFYPLNRFQRVLTSFFSISENIAESYHSTWKIPFTVTARELKAFVGSDVRVGGWGPLFGGAIILSALIIAAAFIYKIPQAKLAVGALVLIIIPSILNPGLWWARYAPQFWLLPIVAAVLSFYNQGKRIIDLLGKALIVVLILNVLLVSSSYFYWHAFYNQILKKQLKYIAESPGEIFVKFRDFRSNRIRLKEAGIKYTEVINLPCRNYIELLAVGGRGTQVCTGRSEEVPVKNIGSGVEEHVERGNLYFQQKDFDAAIAEYDAALKLKPNFAGAYNNRAAAYFLKGEYDQAWEDVRKAQTLGFKMNPEFLEDLCRLSGRKN